MRELRIFLFSFFLLFIITNSSADTNQNFISEAKTSALAGVVLRDGGSLRGRSTNSYRAGVPKQETPRGYPWSFIAISDIHFDPFYTCHKARKSCPIIAKLMVADATDWKKLFERYGSKTPSKYYEDTNFVLLNKVLAEVKVKIDQNSPNFILIAGDFLGHDYKAHYARYSLDNSQEGYQSFVKKTFQFLTQEIRNALPSIPIYAVIGNNDSYLGDYYSVPNGPFYKDLVKIWMPFLVNSENKTSFKNTFPKAGYYSITPAGSPKNKILVLNSILFSQKAQGNVDDVSHAAKVELNWLKEQLSLARFQHQKVWIVFHIPVGIDVFKTISHSHITSLWKKVYTKHFLNYLTSYSANIAGVFTSHLHMDAFELFNLDGKHEIFDSFIPAVSPLFGNNPGFKIFQYNPVTFEVNDYVTYYLKVGNSKWRVLYDFDDLYQPNCKNCRLVDGMEKLHQDNPTSLIASFKHNYALGENNQFINTKPESWPYYWCALRYFQKVDYESCLVTIQPLAGILEKVQ